MEEKQIYKSKISEDYYLLISTKNSINTFVECNKYGTPIIEKRVWSLHPAEQVRIFKGFDKLIKLN